MGRKIDRTGEIGYNSFGSKMELITYRNFNDIDIYFEEYDWVSKHKKYNDFRDGKIKCPYEPRLYGIGFLGEGGYNCYHISYNVWHNMIKRCYCSDKNDNPTYIGCEVCREWYNFQNFAKWYEENYYEIEGQKMHLDKDILIKGNKIYSPQTCVIVPQRINSIFEKHTILNKKEKGKYVPRMKVDGVSMYFGRFETREEAFEVYKKAKEKYIKEVADEYKCYIPTKLYEAMYKYEVEIND